MAAAAPADLSKGSYDRS